MNFWKYIQDIQIIPILSNIYILYYYWYQRNITDWIDMLKNWNQNEKRLAAHSVSIQSLEAFYNCRIRGMRIWKKKIKKCKSRMFSNRFYERGFVGFFSEKTLEFFECIWCTWPPNEISIFVEKIGKSCMYFIENQYFLKKT